MKSRVSLAAALMLALAACEKAHSRLWTYNLDRSTADVLAARCLPNARRTPPRSAEHPSLPVKISWHRKIRSDADAPGRWAFVNLDFSWKFDQPQLSLIAFTIVARSSEFLAHDATQFREVIDCVFLNGRIPPRVAAATLDAIDSLGPDDPQRDEQTAKRASREFKITALRIADEKEASLFVLLSIDPNG